MNVDNEGYLVGDTPAVNAPPPIVAVPDFFEGCATRDHAIEKMIKELGKPASVQLEGFDTMYRNLANALILVLAIQGDLTP